MGGSASLSSQAAAISSNGERGWIAVHNCDIATDSKLVSTVLNWRTDPAHPGPLGQ